MKKGKNDWRAIITAYKTSGQGQTEWCRANNVNINNLRYWLHKEKKATLAAEKTCQWLALDIPVPKPAEDQRLTIHIGQVSLGVNPGFYPRFLADVVKVLVAHAEPYRI